MHGYAVIAPDGKVVGRVAGESERTFVVESGRLRKARQPLPIAPTRLSHRTIRRRDSSP